MNSRLPLSTGAGGPDPRQTAFIPNPKARLQEQIHEAMRFFHYSRRTEEAYWGWIRRFLVWAKLHSHVDAEGEENSTPRGGEAEPNQSISRGGEGGQIEKAKGWRHPKAMGAAEVAAFLSHLAQEANVAAATQNQALNALVFLYGVVLRQPLGELGEWARVQRPARLPAVLSREEIRRVLASVVPEYHLPAQLMYGSGLRLLDLVRLRVKDVDLARRRILVRDGKGLKDRVTMVPDSLVGALQQQLDRARILHEADRRAGHCGVWLPDALGRKLPEASKEWVWFWVFPAKSLSQDPQSGLLRRHHLLEDNLQRAVRLAAARACPDKRVTTHTLRKVSS